MKQVLRMGIREMVVKEIPDSIPGPHQVLVRPLYSLISPGTETASIHEEGLLKQVAENPSRIKQVLDVMMGAGPRDTIREVRAKIETELAALGYSGAGVVVAKHDATVTDLKVGDRVAYGGEGTGHGETVLTGRNLVARIPDGVGCEHACFATLGAIALHSVRLAHLSLGDNVAVIGMGLVGQLVAQLAKLQGGRVFAIDLRADRVRMAEQFGVTGIMGGAGAREAILQATEGRGVDCVIVAAAAKSSAPCLQGIEICRDRGHMIIVGAVEMDLPRDELYVKEIQVSLSRAYGPGSYDPKYEKQGQDYPFSYVRWTENRNMEEFMRQIGTGGLSLEPLISHEFPLEQAPEAYQTILAPGSTSMAVRLKYQAASDADPAAAFVPKRRVDLAPLPAVSKDVIQVALIGAGNLARWSHLPNMQRLPNVVLRAVQSGGGVRATNHATRFGASYATTEFEEVLKDPAVDVVMIMSQHQHHGRQAVAALNAGKHVFIEKPLAITEEECREVARAAKQSGKHVTVGFNRRFAPFYAGLKSEVKRRSGPVVVNCRMNSPGISGPHWAADPISGGAVLGECCHFADLIYWLLESEPVRVSSRVLPGDQAGSVGSDSMASVIEFADGSVANLTYCTVGSKTSGGERLEVFGSGFGVETENFRRLTVKRGMAKTSSKFFPDKGYTEQLESFFQAIRKGSQQAITLEDGVRATMVCLKLLQASRVNEFVPVDWQSALL